MKNVTFFKNSKYLDDILESLNNERFFYTTTYQQLFDIIKPAQKFSNIYSTAFDKLLLEGYDRYIHDNSQPLKFDFALIFLRNEGYITIDSLKNIQITFKGILKCSYSFAKEYDDKLQENDRKNKQQKFDNKMAWFRVFSPYIIFILGFFSAYIIEVLKNHLG